MKNRFKIVFMAFFVMTMSAFAGNITVDENSLPSEVLAKLKAQQKVEQVTESLTTGKEWAEMGRAIGIATREGLSAVSDETAKFADTTPGRFTMAIIAWKVAGEDFKAFVRSVVVGIPFLIFWLSLYMWWLHKVYCQRKLKRVIYVGEGKERKKEIQVEYLPALSLEYPDKKNGWDDNAWIPVVVPHILFVIVAFIIIGWLVF